MISGSLMSNAFRYDARGERDASRPAGGVVIQANIIMTSFVNDFVERAGKV